MEGQRRMAISPGNCEVANCLMPHRMTDLEKGMLKEAAHVRCSTLYMSIYTDSLVHTCNHTTPYAICNLTQSWTIASAQDKNGFTATDKELSVNKEIILHSTELHHLITHWLRKY